MAQTSTTTTTTRAVQRASFYGVDNYSTESLGPISKRVSCFAGLPSHSFNQSSKLLRNPVQFMVDQPEFDKLPPAVRRKYFSSIERLRFAQQSASSTTLAPPGCQRSKSTSNVLTKPKPQSRASYCAPEELNSRLPRLRRHSPSVDDFLMSQSDARFFLNMPESVQRKHFSPEDCALLKIKCESIVANAGNRSLYELGHEANGSLSSLDSIEALERPSPIAESPRKSDDKRASMASVDSDVFRATQEFRKSFQWIDKDVSVKLGLGLAPFEEDPLDMRPISAPQQSNRRSFSFTNKDRSFLRSSPSTRNPSTHRRGPSFSKKTISPNPTPNSIPNPLPSPTSPVTVSSMEGDAAYYQDPEARLKLRVYLASPSKFDEAVEFGFPSNSEGQAPPQKGSRTSLLEELSIEDSDAALNEDETGRARAMSSLSATKESWGEPVPLSPRLQSSQSNASHRASFGGNREMTLRMTLTRPDLRADESLLYGWSESNIANNVAPQQQVEVISDTKADAQGGQAETDALGLKKLWRRVVGW